MKYPLFLVYFLLIMVSSCQFGQSDLVDKNGDLLLLSRGYYAAEGRDFLINHYANDYRLSDDSVGLGTKEIQDQLKRANNSYVIELKVDVDGVELILSGPGHDWITAGSVEKVGKDTLSFKDGSMIFVLQNDSTMIVGTKSKDTWFKMASFYKTADYSNRAYYIRSKNQDKIYMHY